MARILVAGIDPSLTNLGIARMAFDTETNILVPEMLSITTTEPDKGKHVRKNSSDLRRARELYKGVQAGCTGCAIAFAEVPSAGAQSARALWGLGIALGILASTPVPLVQVQNTEVKLAAVGTKTASKEEMIEWAVEAYPQFDWPKRGDKIVKGKAEHLADAVACIHAGIKTDAFLQVAAILSNRLQTAA